MVNHDGQKSRPMLPTNHMLVSPLVPPTTVSTYKERRKDRNRKEEKIRKGEGGGGRIVDKTIVK